MPAIDWSQVSPGQMPDGAIDWNSVNQAINSSTPQQIATDAITKGAQDLPYEPSDALGGVSQSVLDLARAAGHNAMKPLHGLAQFMENAAAKGASLLPDNPVSRAITATAAQDNAAQQQNEQEYQKLVPNNPASYTGAAIGTVAPFLLSGPAKGLQALGDTVASAFQKAAPAVSSVAGGIVPKVVSSATQGGTLAVASPVDNGQNYWSQKGQQVKSGVQTGAVIPPIAALARGVADAASPIFNPQSVVRRGLQAWGVTPDAINATELVPGSLPTLAQSAPNPSVIAAEKALANNPSYRPLFDARTAANNDARWQAINQIAQTPQALQDAIQARSAATQPMIDKLLTNGNPVPVGGILDQLDALAKSPLGMRPAVGSAAKDIADQIRSAAATGTDGSATIGPAHLDAVRQNVKDFLAKYAPNGAVSTQQQAAFEPVRNAIVDSIEGSNPGYRDYLAKYAQLSVPINTMEAGQSIVDNLGSRAAGTTGAASLSLSGVNTQTNKALDRPYGISPDAEATLHNLQADLQRSTISNSMRSPGSDTAYNLQAPGWLGQALYGQNFQGGKLLPTLAGLGGGILGLMFDGGLSLKGALHAGMYGSAAAGATAGLANKASSKVNGLLADALLNPQRAAEILQEQPTSPLLQSAYRRVPQLGLLASRPLALPQGSLLQAAP